MPIYMDVHIVPGVKARNVAEAHMQDLVHQDEFGCKCMTYWIDETRESIFCLVEAPDKDTVRQMHSKSHGLIPHKIVEVSSSVVQSFLGRIYDPETAELSGDGLKVFTDPAFRILLVTKTIDPVLLKHRIGTEKASELLKEYNHIIRKNIYASRGAEAEHSGNDFIISYSSGTHAVSCALAILNDLSAILSSHLDFKISLCSGEPIEKTNRLFGDALHFASCLFALRGNSRCRISSALRDLISKDYMDIYEKNFLVIPPQDEVVLESLLKTLETNWHDADFDVDKYCRVMAMSSSQLYRKTVALTGLSPNLLLKEFRLEKARLIMKQRHYNISQITFDSGFTSPSYFTKCFKKKFGILPMNYMELL